MRKDTLRPDDRCRKYARTGEDFVFYEFLSHAAMFTERIGQPWIWFFHPLESSRRPVTTSLVPSLGWRYYCPIEQLDEIVSILSELLPR